MKRPMAASLKEDVGGKKEANYLESEVAVTDDRLQSFFSTLTQMNTGRLPH